MVSSNLPPLNPLKAFEAAGRHLSLVGAAAELNVTPAAVSRQVKLLEDTLDIVLFERRHRALALTREGEQYLAEISPALARIGQATGRLRSNQRGDALNIHSYTTFALRWLIPRMADFQEKHPSIKVHLSASTKRIRFETDNLDGAIRFGSGAWSSFRATRLFPARLTPVCAPQLVSARTLSSPADLSKHTLLHSLARSGDWSQWLEAVGHPDFYCPQELRFENSSMAYQAAIEGIGVAIAQTDFVEADVAAGRLVFPIDRTVELKAGYYFISPKATPESATVRTFREWLSSCVVKPGADATSPNFGKRSRDRS